MPRPIATSHSAPRRVALARRRAVAWLVAMVLLLFHSAGEAFHYLAHAPVETAAVQASRASRFQSHHNHASQIMRSHSGNGRFSDSRLLASDDDCAFCQLASTSGLAAALPAPVLLPSSALWTSKAVGVGSLAAISPIRPRAPGPPRAPPVSFV